MTPRISSENIHWHTIWIVGALCLISMFLVTETTAEPEPIRQDSIGEPDGEYIVCEHADEFKQLDKEGLTILTGNVRFKRVDGYIHADKVTIYRDVETDETTKAVAEHNVEILDSEALATCDQAILYYSNDTVDLSGNVVVIQNKDRLESERFVSERRTGKQTAYGSVKIDRPDGFLNGDTVTIYKNVETNALIKTIAEGHVEIRDQQIFANCDYATIEHVDGTVYLRDHVVVIQGEDRLESEEFTYNQNTGEKTGKGNVKFKVRVNQQTKPDAKSETVENEKAVR